MEYKGEKYTSFILSYVDGVMVKAQLFRHKYELVVMGNDLKSLSLKTNHGKN